MFLDKLDLTHPWHIVWILQPYPEFPQTTSVTLIYNHPPLTLKILRIYSKVILRNKRLNNERYHVINFLRHCKEITYKSSRFCFGATLSSLNMNTKGFKMLKCYCIVTVFQKLLSTVIWKSKFEYLSLEYRSPIPQASLFGMNESEMKGWM